MNYIFNKSLVKTNVKVNDWIQAVKIAGDLLIQNDLVEARFVDAMIDIVKEKGPYIVISKNLAIPHARPEDGAKKVGISVVTLEKPVKFGHKQNDPVKVVIALTSIDEKSHIELISHLARVLSNKQNFERLKTADTEEEVVKILGKEVQN
ncbi:MAG: mannitol operon transcriptional activator [Thermosediminibacterales bacterium]|nr:mannitol operon transcriptional activator [Thermosediminibacterales bacterium]